MMNTTQRSSTEHSSRCGQYVLPPVNIREDKDAYVLEADMPGVNKESLEITIEGSELTILGRRNPTSIGGEALLKEQRHNDYRRVFEIDPAINSTGITAHMQQGLLTLTLPKSEQVKPRKIAVNG